MHETFDLIINFEFSTFQNKSMRVEAFYNDNIYIANKDDPVLKINKIKLPTSIKLVFLGKTLGKDTKIDKFDNIVEDMYVKIKSIKISNLTLPDWIVQKKFSYTTETGQYLTTSYIGFNGTMLIDIPETNIFSFYRRLNKDE